MRRPDKNDEKTELITTVLGIMAGAAVGVAVATAITDTPLTWALILGGVLGIGLVFVARRQDKERW